MAIKDFDGTYEISYHYEISGGAAGVRAQGQLCDGVFHGADVLGCTWDVTLSEMSDGNLEYIAHVDARNALPNAFVPNGDGVPVRARVTYTGLLNVIRIGNTYRGVGQLALGPITVEINLKRL